MREGKAVGTVIANGTYMTTMCQSMKSVMKLTIGATTILKKVRLTTSTMKCLTLVTLCLLSQTRKSLQVAHRKEFQKAPQRTAATTTTTVPTKRR